MGSSFGFSEITGFVLGLIGLLVTFIGLYRKIQNDHDEDNLRQDKALAKETDTRMREDESMRKRMEHIRDASREEVSNLDKRFIILEERLNQVPTRGVIEDIVDTRVRSLQMDLRALTLQLTRINLYDPSERILKNNEDFNQ